MSPASSKVLVAVTDHTALVKVSGRATFTCSADFRAFVHRLRERGCRRYVVDLTTCAIMDSTFLGMLAGFGTKLAEGDGEAGLVRLLNPNARIVDLLENLGVAHLFELIQGAAPLVVEGNGATEMTPRMDRLAISRTALEAHETLMAIHPDNVPKFKDVTRYLAEDLKRLEDRASDDRGRPERRDEPSN
jgi:anti-anti-sigma regulatory factor